MKKICGRLGAEVICPLCYTIYKMSNDEIFLYKERSTKKRKRYYFYCDICDRNVVVDGNDNIQIGLTRLMDEEQV